MTQFGWAQASSGVTLRQRLRIAAAKRPARRGQDDRATRSCQVLRSSGRHWKIAECSLSIGSSVAPPSRDGGARTARRRRPALPCWRAAAACRRAPRPGTARGRRRRRSPPSRHRPRDAPRARTARRAPLMTSVATPAARSRSLSTRASAAVGHRRVAWPEALALREQLVDAAPRRQREDLEPLRMAGDHVERRYADRAGRAEDADALPRAELSRSCGSQRCQCQRDRKHRQQARRRDRACRRDRAAAGCCPWRRRCA